MLTELITKRDNFEIVRDQVASLIVLELANQRALAAAAEISTAPWQAHVYLERYTPWEHFIDSTGPHDPVINVTYDASDWVSGDSTKTQQYDVKINIDCYGCSPAMDTQAGHDAADKSAAIISQRAARLCRNILMSAENAVLKLHGVVGSRRVQQILPFRPDTQESRAPLLQPVSAVRLALLVSLIETSPQVTGEIIELIDIAINRAENGALLVSAQYDLS